MKQMKIIHGDGYNSTELRSFKVSVVFGLPVCLLPELGCHLALLAAVCGVWCVVCGVW